MKKKRKKAGKRICFFAVFMYFKRHHIEGVIIAPIAQLVEQMTLNHWVLGSSPRGRTIIKYSAISG